MLTLQNKSGLLTESAPWNSSCLWDRSQQSKLFLSFYCIIWTGKMIDYASPSKYWLDFEICLKKFSWQPMIFERLMNYPKVKLNQFFFYIHIFSMLFVKTLKTNHFPFLQFVLSLCLWKHAHQNAIFIQESFLNRAPNSHLDLLPFFIYFMFFCAWFRAKEVCLYAFISFLRYRIFFPFKIILSEFFFYPVDGTRLVNIS